jgi:hypothetical protein
MLTGRAADSAALLEIGVFDLGCEDAAVIHAISLRRKSRRPCSPNASPANWTLQPH